MSAISKLREAYKAEVKQRAEIMKLVKIERASAASLTVSVPVVTTKIVIDEDKLEKTIAKAKETSNALKKAPIVVLEKPPKPHPTVPTSAAAAATTTSKTICQARNLNGTPCKCKATKLGKFCGKHAP